MSTLTNPTTIARTVATGGPGGGNGDRFVVDMKDMLWEYGPNRAPLTRISSKRNKRKARNPTYKVMNDKQLPRLDYVNGNQTLGDTAIEVVNGAFYRVGDVVQNTRTKEQFLVTDKPSANTLTAVRGYDSVAAGTGVAMLDNDELMIMFNALSERQASPSVLTTDPATVNNFIQRFGRTIGVSEQRNNTDEYGPKEKERQNKQAMNEIMKDIEYAFLYGTPINDEEGNSPVDSAVADTRRKTF